MRSSDLRQKMTPKNKGREAAIDSQTGSHQIGTLEALSSFRNTCKKEEEKN